MTEEWLSVLPGRATHAELTDGQLCALTLAPEVRQAGACLEARTGQDASGRRRVRLRVSHEHAQVVALTRDALLREGRRLALRVFLV